MPLLIFQPYTGSADAGTPGVTATGYDPYFDSVVSQMHFEGADGGVVFADVCNNTITVSGATTTTASAKFGSSSANFSGGYLTMPGGTFQPVATTAFTIEMWVKPSATSATTKCVGVGAVDPISSTGYWSFGLTSANLASFYFNTGSDNFATGTTTIPLDTWTHLAVTVTNAGLGTVWVNGISDATFTLVTPTANTTDICVGQWNNVKFPGTMDELRITRGVARYAATFTPSAAAFPDSFAIGTYDPYFDYVTVLANGETPNSTTDVTGKTNWTTNTAIGSSIIKRLGNKSMYFNGTTSTQMISTTSTAAITTNATWTLEFWVNPTTTGTARALISSRPTNTASVTSLFVYIKATGELSLQTNVDRLNGPKLPLNAWTHVAISLNGGTGSLYINGVDYTGPVGFGSTFSTTGFAIGSNIDGSLPFAGYMDDVRFTRLTQRYTSSFVLPKTRYPVKSSIHSSGSDVLAKFTTLQLKMDGTPGGALFTDDCGRAFTKFGNPTLSSAQYKFGGTSAAFNGTTDYLTYPWTTSDIFGTSEFTVECWAYQNARSTSSTIFSFAGATGSAGISVAVNSTGAVVVSNHNGAYLTTTATLPLTTWTHIALCRAGTTLACYINGVLSASTTNSTNLTDQICRIGNSTEGTNWWNGYIDSVRVTKGICRYPSAFVPDNFGYSDLNVTPYNAKFNDELVTASYDTYSAKTALLMQFEGPNGGTTFTDTCGAIATRVGTPTLSTAQFKYGTSSAFFNGTSDYLTLPANTNYSFGVGDFTVECWCWLTGGIPNTNGKMLFDARPTGANGAYWVLGLNGAGKLSFDTTTSNGSPELLAPAALPTGQWVHVAVTRASGVLTLWQNGVSVATISNNIDNLGSSGLRIGQNTFGPADTFWNGYIDEVRFTKGAARYTNTFTPAQCLPLSPVTLQMGFDELAFVDYTLNNTFTNSGTVISTHSFVDSGAAYFSGTSSLTGNNPATAQFGSGNFTVECWIKPTAIVAGATAGIFASHAAANSITGFYLAYDTSYVLKFGYNATAEVVASSAMSTNAWNHVAAVRSDNTLTLWLNGKDVGSVPFTRTLTDSLVLIGKTVDLAYGPIGFIDNLRITKAARYTAAFVPSAGVIPTASSAVVAGDPYFGNVSFLMHMDGVNAGTSFQDVKNNVITRNGSAITSTDQIKFGTSSLKLNGSTDYLSVQPNPNFSFGTGDFTVELWTYTNGAGLPNTYGKMMIDTRPLDTNGAYWGIGLDPSGKLSATTMSVGGASLLSSSYMPIGQWVHVAFTRKAGTVGLWQNGALVASVANNTDNMSNSGLLIGANSFKSIATDTYWNGFFDDIRITKGVARYSTNFVPPTASFLDTEGTSLSDPSFNNVKSLMHMEGANNGTSFADQRGNTWTVNGTVITSTAQSMFGTSSAYFNGASTLMSQSGAAPVGAQGADFTVELWARPSSASASARLWSWQKAGGSSVLTIYQSGGKFVGEIRSSDDSGSTVLNSLTNVTADTWYHLALVRSGGVLTLYINGVSEASAPDQMQDLSDTTSMYLGGWPGTPSALYTGYIDDVRVTNVARYTSAFAVPVAAFPDAA